jgi:hypothetical protein
MSSYNSVFNELQDYILNEENIQKSLRMKIYTNKNDNNVKTLKNNNDFKPNDFKPNDFKTNLKPSSLCIPNQQDALFWCFYIMKNGDVKYEMLPNKNSLIAKQIKIDLVSTIRKNKDIIKTYKFDTKSNIESNLANDNNINSKTFLSLCAIENINVIYISKKTYYELLMNDTNIIYIIREIPSQSKYYNKYGFEMATEESLNNIRSSFYKIENVDKPIKASSSYKVQDLIEMCIKLAIETTNKETGKTKSKNDLYESIIQYF